MTGLNWGESLLGPMLTVEPAMKWLAVSTAVVNLVHGRAIFDRDARLRK
jgi:hypothetical protein